jgi:hypothetical protein
MLQKWQKERKKKQSSLLVGKFQPHDLLNRPLIDALEIAMDRLQLQMMQRTARSLLRTSLMHFTGRLSPSTSVPQGRSLWIHSP